MKITDHCNAFKYAPPCPASPGLAATSVTSVFSISTPCTDPGGGAGATCQIATTLDSVVAGSVEGGYRMNVESTVGVDDGGSDGDPGTAADNRNFATEGFFVP